MARAALEDARDRVAALLGCRSSREVVFTSGGTEAVTMATFGACRRTPGGRVVVAAVEHSAVRRASERWAGGGCAVPAVDRHGRIQMAGPAAVDGAALVHCQWGNHEVGTLQPVAEVVALARAAGALVHVDACQAAGRVSVDFQALDADLLSVSAAKLGGPRGMGALLLRRGLRLPPLFLGGEQERSRRAGTENVAGAVGFGAACAHAADHLDEEQARSRHLLDRLLKGATAVEGVSAYTPGDGHRLPHIACLGIRGVEAEPVLVGLDQAGVAVHSGSSCSSETLEPSPVLQAMGVDADRSLRASLGWTTTEADVDAFLDAFPGVVARLLELGAGGAEASA
jgi:cysteine desulfurase